MTDETQQFIKAEHERILKMCKVKTNEEIRPFMAMKIMEEVGELCQELLADYSYQRQDKLQNRKSNTSEEIIDVLLTTMILAENVGIDLQTALNHGIEKRLKREYK